MSELGIYKHGPVHCSICTNIEDRDEVVSRVNEENPTMDESQWEISEDESFASGESNPCPCEQKQGFQHYLMVC